jgi:hypothetical protein
MKKEIEIIKNALTKFCNEIYKNGGVLSIIGFFGYILFCIVSLLYFLATIMENLPK